MGSFYQPLNSASLDDYLRRAAKISGITQPLWGELNAARMFAHLRRHLELALGEVHAQGRNLRWAKWAVLWMLTRQRPYPRNSRTAPSLWPDELREAEAEREHLSALMTRFSSELEDDPDEKQPHPFLGPLKRSDWSKLIGKHIEHHLRQFGA